jgi:hypothetical protein
MNSEKIEHVAEACARFGEVALTNVHKLETETKVGLLKRSMSGCVYGARRENSCWDGIVRCPIYSPVPLKLPMTCHDTISSLPISSPSRSHQSEIMTST